MPIEIRPFTENKSDTPSAEPGSDSRASAFMETLRARINIEDEARQEKWDKAAAKASSRRKPPVPRPDWLNESKPAEKTAKPAKTPRPHPLASTRKPKGS